MSRIATLKTFIEKRKHPLCGHFMVNIGVSFFTTTINHFDIVVLGVRRIKIISSLT